MNPIKFVFDTVRNVFGFHGDHPDAAGTFVAVQPVATAAEAQPVEAVVAVQPVLDVVAVQPVLAVVAAQPAMVVAGSQMAKRNSKTQPKYGRNATFGKLAYDREMTTARAAALVPLLEAEKASVMTWPKERARAARVLYSRIGKETPDWLKARPDIKSMVPGSCSDKVDCAMMTGPWFRSAKQAKLFVKYVQFHEGKHWKELTLQECGLLAARMKRLLAKWNKAKKTAKGGGPAVPLALKQDMQWAFADGNVGHGGETGEDSDEESEAEVEDLDDDMKSE